VARSSSTATPGQWFDAPFVPFDVEVAPAERPQPEILVASRRVASRRELDPLLYAPARLEEPDR
jgi:hypothetical protein